MGCSGIDLTIEAAMTDPLIAAAMRADRVDPRRLEDLLRSTARDLDAERRPHPSFRCGALERGRAIPMGPTAA